MMLVEMRDKTSVAKASKLLAFTHTASHGLIMWALVLSSGLMTMSGSGERSVP